MREYGVEKEYLCTSGDLDVFVLAKLLAIFHEQGAVAALAAAALVVVVRLGRPLEPAGGRLPAAKARAPCKQRES